MRAYVEKNKLSSQISIGWEHPSPLNVQSKKGEKTYFQ